MNLSGAYRYFRKGRTFFFAHEAIRRAREAVAKHEAARAHYETCAAMTEAWANLLAICRAIRDSVAGYVETIRDARERMAKALEGEGPHGLCVCMRQDEKAAFCDAGGLDSFPA